MNSMETKLPFEEGPRLRSRDRASRRERSLWKAPIGFVVAYALLMAPWPGWMEAYGKIYSSTASYLFDSKNPERRVLIRHAAAAAATSKWSQDTSVLLMIRGESVGSRRVKPFSTVRSSRYTGYVPIALVVALVVATPIPWRRRLRALPWAVLLASGFSAAMLWIWIHGWFYGQECISLALTSPEYRPRVRMVGSILKMSTEMGPYYITPILIWVFVSFRREDLESLQRRLQPSEQPGTSRVS